MTEQYETVDERLERLAQATSGLRARSDFADRVMLAVGASSAPSWLESVSSSARTGILVAVLAAAAAVALAAKSDLAANEASAVAYGAMEVEW
jgi:hypothetical protein